MALLSGCLGPAHRQITPPPITVTRSTVPPAEARQHYIEGHRHLARAEWDEAAASFEEALLFDAHSPDILRGLAAAAGGRGDTAARDDYLLRAAAAEERR